MFWKTGLLLVALAFGQVPAELATPVFIEDALSQGQASGVSSRILSGWEAQLGELPYQVSLRMVDSLGGVGGCGGSIVHRSWIITAAHCTAGRTTVVVRAGLVHLTRPEYLFETHEWWNHPSYDESRPSVVQPNEICILKLQKPLSYSDNLKPIRIQSTADASKNYEQEILIASGWGRLWTEGLQPEVLNWVYLRGLSNAQCAGTYGTALINEAAICAQWYNVTSQSTCQGDSGGPLAYTDASGASVLVGIASFVAGGTWGCHSGLPAGFVRPGPFLGWLEEVSGINFEDFVEDEEATELPTTSTTVAPTTSPTTLAPTTLSTPEPEGPAPESEEDEDDDDEDSDLDDSEEDEQISELLKKLTVKVKVKVILNNKVKRKVKVKCVDKF